MKHVLKKILEIGNTAWLLLFSKGVRLTHTRFINFRLAAGGNNDIHLEGCRMEKGGLYVSGSGNKIRMTQALVSNATIRIEGDRNELYIAEKVKLRSSTVIIRGTGCKVLIQKNTTFGGIRIINSGTDNLVSIGENCLFADQIELWASDTHPIFNEAGDIINREKPVVIGNNVWVGSRVTLLKGITIHDNSIIGMGSLVTNDVPAAVISAGSPNKTIRENVRWALHYPGSHLNDDK